MTHKLSYLGICAVAWLVADLLFPPLIRLARRLGALDKPGGHKAQREPVPFLGGFGIFIALTATLLLTLRFEHIDKWLPLAGIPLGGLFVLGIGLLDDWRPVNAVLKLLLLFIGSLIVLAFGVGATLFPGPWGIVPNIVISMLWIAGVTSAMNSLDNTDGAAGGVAAIAAAGVCLLSLTQPEVVDQPYILALAFALLGTCMAFLRYNWPRARIYLGDNGSFFLGFTLACTLLFAGWNTDPVRAAITPVILLTVPLLDLGLSTILRYKSGVVKTWRQAVVYCGHDHLAHRLHALGFSRVGATVILWTVSALAAVEALILCSVRSGMLFWCVLGGHALFVLTFSLILARAPVYTRAERADPVVPAEELPRCLSSHLTVLLRPEGSLEGARRTPEAISPQEASLGEITVL